MNRVLAAIDETTAARTVLATAAVFADLLGASVHALHVRDPAARSGTVPAAGAAPLTVVDGDPVTEVIRAVEQPDVTLVVLGATAWPTGPRPVGHVARAVLEAAGKPVVVAPLDGGPPAGRAIDRALIPLEGTRETSASVADALRQLIGAGVEPVAVHVLDPSTVPRFWDQPSHAAESYAAEFTSRWCTEPGVDLRLRRGAPADEVVRAAVAEGVDLIALVWSQDLGQGRAQVVRAALAQAGVPVLLIPAPRVASREARR
jgi:nucleotide-binding universal stress UspA family protein